MRKTVRFFLSILLSATMGIFPSLRAQESDAKQTAVEFFGKGHYTQAVSILETAVRDHPQDAELHYLLGFYTHYLCYDSVPLIGFDQGVSDRILGHLETAIRLDPDLGDAYYFLGAEYGARAVDALRARDTRRLVRELKEGLQKQAFPKWMLEYARNMLRSCEKDAVLFTGGDAEYNPLIVIQQLESFRKDVTIIPAALLNRPWFVLILKQGLRGFLPALPIRWSEEQILDMHPYKAKDPSKEIPVSPQAVQRYGIDLPPDSLKLVFKPSLLSDTDGRTFLRTGDALVCEFLSANEWRKPVYFTMGSNLQSDLGLTPFLQMSGFVLKLLPVAADPHGLAMDVPSVEKILLDPENLKNFSDVTTHPMPRVMSLLNNYRTVLLNLAVLHQNTGHPDRARDVLRFMDTHMPETVLPVPDYLKPSQDRIRELLDGSSGKKE